MISSGQQEANKQQLLAQFAAMYDRLCAWRAAHPAASFDEIAKQVTPERRVMMGMLLEQLACHHGRGEVAEGLRCEVCGEVMEYKGEPERVVEHLEGESQLKRAYYHCPRCRSGVFPPGPTTEVG